MHKAIIIAGMLAFSTAASAADIGSYKDTPATQTYGERNPFLGFNSSINGGGQFGNLDLLNTFDGIGNDGLVGGAHIGYNLGFGRVVLGAYAEGGFSDVNTEIAGIDLLNMDSYLQAGILVGYLFTPATMASLHAGYEWQQWSSDLPGAPDIEATAFAVGGGIDTLIREHVSLGIKVDYLPLDSMDIGGTDVTQFVEESESFRAVARLTYRH